MCSLSQSKFSRFANKGITNIHELFVNIDDTFVNAHDMFANVRKIFWKVCTV